MPYSYSPYKYCPQCGTLLHLASIGGRSRPHCSRCQFTHWGEYSIGVGGVLLHENKGLLVQRAYNPGKGRWTIPGGFVEEDEKIEEAVTRELLEETGLHTEPLSILGIRDRPQDEPGVKHDVYIVFLLRLLSGQLCAQEEEVSQLGFFSPEEYLAMNIAPLSLFMLETALQQKERGAEVPGFTKKANVSMIGNLSHLFSLE